MKKEEEVHKHMNNTNHDKNDIYWVIGGIIVIIILSIIFTSCNKQVCTGYTIEDKNSRHNAFRRITPNRNCGLYEDIWSPVRTNNHFIKHRIR